MSFGIGPEHIPELIRLMQDEELWEYEESEAEEDEEKVKEPPQVYAYIHAWHALGQLRAEAAIEPMLDMIAANSRKEIDWNDWVVEELPRALAEIGPVAIPATVARLDKRLPQDHVVSDFALVLTQIAERHPDTRAEVIRELCRVLDTAAENEADANGLVIANLLDLKAVEAWPSIEKAFASGNVEEFIAGDAADVKYSFGLGPKPPDRRLVEPSPQPTHSSGLTAKQRAEARARQRKAEKKKRKKKRRGK